MTAFAWFCLGCAVPLLAGIAMNIRDMRRAERDRRLRGIRKMNSRRLLEALESPERWSDEEWDALCKTALRRAPKC